MSLDLRKKKMDASTKTPVQVAIRIRPNNDSEKMEPSIVSKTSNTTVSCRNKSYGPFDYVYSQEASQATLFQDIVQPQIGKVLDGFNCTIFAYGQTGTGKTYTMEGGSRKAKSSREDPSTGITPRAVEEIFRQLEEKGLEEHSIRVSYIELYNEELYDLLSMCTERPRLRLFEDPARKGNVIVSGAEEIPVRTRDEVYDLLSRGASVRATAETQMNDKSSRSHSIFTIHVTIREYNDQDEELVKMGKLYLVDLAGSENIGRSGVEGKRAKEAGNINQSLLTLGRVIEALVTSKQHIPYRESKLTRLLQDSLGGSTITCIISTISAAGINFEETTSTLQYAMRALNIKNNPACNMHVSRKEMMKQFNGEIEKLKRDLRAARDKKGTFISNESLEDLEKTAQVERQLREQIEEKLEGMVIQMQRYAEDMDELHSQYKLVYNRQTRLQEKLKVRVDELDSIKEELDVTKNHLLAYTSAAGELKAGINTSNRQLQDVLGSWRKLKSDVKRWWAVHDDAVLVSDENERSIGTAVFQINNNMVSSRAAIDDHMAETERLLNTHCDSSKECVVTINSFLEATRANHGNVRVLVNQASSDITGSMKIAQETTHKLLEMQSSTMKANLLVMNSAMDSQCQNVSEMAARLKADLSKNKEMVVDQSSSLKSANGNLIELASQLRCDAEERTQKCSQDVLKYDTVGEQLRNMASVIQQLTETVADLKQARSEEDARQVSFAEERINATVASAQTVGLVSAAVQEQFMDIMSSNDSYADRISEINQATRSALSRTTEEITMSNDKFEDSSMEIVNGVSTSCSKIVTIMAESVEKEMQIANGTLDQLEVTVLDVAEDTKDLRNQTILMSTNLVETLGKNITAVQDSASAATVLKKMNSELTTEKMVEIVDETIPDAPKMKALLNKFGYYNMNRDTKRIRESLLENVQEVASPGTFAKKCRLDDIQEIEKENIV